MVTLKQLTTQTNTLASTMSSLDSSNTKKNERLTMCEHDLKNNDKYKMQNDLKTLKTEFTSCNASMSFYNSSLVVAKAKLKKKDTANFTASEKTLNEKLDELKKSEKERASLNEQLLASRNERREIQLNKMKTKWAEYFKYSVDSLRTCIYNSECVNQTCC